MLKIWTKFLPISKRCETKRRLNFLSSLRTKHSVVKQSVNKSTNCFVVTPRNDEIKIINYEAIAYFYQKRILPRFARQTRAFDAFGLPIVQVILFGFALSNEIKNTGIAVFDQDKSVISSALISKIDANKYFDIDRNLTNPNQFQEAFKDGKVKIVLVIPSDFLKI